jgi:O-6-methylguanine DNA methyltransferase
VTYGDLARAAGRPAAARSVGRILGANPVPLLVPCHRCLPAARGRGGARRLGGYSGPGGFRQKARLLHGEGVVLDPAHAAGLAHLRRIDPVLRRLIARIGPYLAAPEEREPPAASLLRAIIHQQISVAAGRTIAGRLAALTPGPGLPTPAELQTLDDAALRAAGLSSQKLRYARDLAARIAAGRLRPHLLHRLPDAAAVGALTGVKGIGRWTAHMFLIFQLGRLDVLPVDDLGLRRAVQRAWRLPAPPDAAALEARADAWRPYRSMASWYLWRGLDTGGI